MARRDYYWLVCRDPDTGKPYLIKGGDSETEAREKGLEMLSGIDFDIKALPTRDTSAASAMIRGKRLEDTHDLRTARQRLGHERSVDRMRNRLKRRVV